MTVREGKGSRRRWLHKRGTAGSRISQKDYWTHVQELRLVRYAGKAQGMLSCRKVPQMAFAGGVRFGLRHVFEDGDKEVVQGRGFEPRNHCWTRS